MGVEIFFSFFFLVNKFDMSQNFKLILGKR